MKPIRLVGIPSLNGTVYAYDFAIENEIPSRKREDSVQYKNKLMRFADSLVDATGSGNGKCNREVDAILDDQEWVSVTESAPGNSPNQALVFVDLRSPLFGSTTFITDGTILSTKSRKRYRRTQPSDTGIYGAVVLNNQQTITVNTNALGVGSVTRTFTLHGRNLQG